MKGCPRSPRVIATLAGTITSIVLGQPPVGDRWRIEQSNISMMVGTNHLAWANRGSTQAEVLLDASTRRFECERSDSISEYRSSSPFIPDTRGEWAIEATPTNMINSDNASSGP